LILHHFSCFIPWFIPLYIQAITFYDNLQFTTWLSKKLFPRSL
jgi:hypothetical protein